MSGIAGIVHFNGAPIAPGLIEKMTSAMAQRGPDGIDHRVQGSVALGQCMLRTTPESLEELPFLWRNYLRFFQCKARVYPFPFRASCSPRLA